MTKWLLSHSIKNPTDRPKTLSNSRHLDTNIKDLKELGTQKIFWLNACGLVAFKLGSLCLFKRPSVRKPMGFCIPKLNVFCVDYKSHLCTGTLQLRPAALFTQNLLLVVRTIKVNASFGRLTQVYGHLQRPDRQVFLQPIADSPANDAPGI